MAFKSRLAFIDLLRGWALLVMIEVHVFNAFILPQYQTTSWFKKLDFINGLVAPSFIFISGFVFLLASQKKLESFRAFGPAFWKQLGRIGLIWLVGYSLHLPYFSFFKSVTYSTEEQLLSFYQSDVLHCIAFGLLALFLLRLIIRNDRIYSTVLLLSGLFVMTATMFIWDIDFTALVPAPIAAYLNNKHYSLFPLFPWTAFMFFGGYFATGYIRAREQQKEKKIIQKFAVIGPVILTAAFIAGSLSIHVPYASAAANASPAFFFQRLGIVILLLTACWYYAEYRKTEKSFVLDVSRESLLVYTVHLLVIYGRFWNERSLYYYYGNKYGVPECIAGTLILAVSMVCMAVFWGWLKRNHFPLARIFSWMLCVTIIIYFFAA
ncbi:MAG: DUF1624 domain-containing protein [Bacteroidetes bacterium]|nr:DUF1624 domain-containing protein [Bacteroidota bacterium]